MKNENAKEVFDNSYDYIMPGCASTQQTGNP